MNAAFGLVLPAPTACAVVFAICDTAGAGHAADRRVAARDQRVPGQAVFLHVGADILGRPMGQRVDLDAPGAGFNLEEFEAGTGLTLIALAARDPAVEPLESALQRF